MTPQEEFEASAREANDIRRRRAEFDLTITADTADRLTRAMYGGNHTNPEVKAALGLSDMSADYSSVHDAAQRAMRRLGTLPQNIRADLGADIGDVPTGIPQPTLWDMLRVVSQPGYRRGVEPLWWNDVDPSGQWRALSVPQIKTANDVVGLNEAQAMKALAGLGPTGWLGLDGWTRAARDDSGNLRLGQNPGTIDQLETKFPNMWSYLKELHKEPSTIEKVGKVVSDTTATAMRQMGNTLTVVPRLLSMFAPDQLSVVGEPISKTARGASKGITAALMGAAQGLKGYFEWVLTRQREGNDTFGATPIGGGAFILTAPTPTTKDLEDFRQIVVEGNILTEIAKRIADPSKKLELGGGFFPEGIAAQTAREKHDAGLPKVGGRTWTAGRALSEPLIQAEIIDRNGYAASVISGITDAVFTLATDPSVYTDPVKILASKLNIGEKVAARLLESEAAEKVYQRWAEARRAAGEVISPTMAGPGAVIDLGPYAITETGQPIVVNAGELPAVSSIGGPEITKFIDDIVENTVRDQSLAALPSPPIPRVPQLPTGRNAIEARHGVIDLGDGRKTIDPMQIDLMPSTLDGQYTLRRLGSFTNSGELYDAMLGNLPVGIAYGIQKYVDAAKAAGKIPDTAEIHRILVDGVMSGDPLYNIRNVPGFVGQIFHQTGDVIAHWANKRTRVFASMPRSTYFNFDDPISGIDNMNKLMVAMGVPVADRHAMLSETIRAVVETGKGARFELANRWMDTMIGPKLRAAGVSEEDIKTLTKWSQRTDGEVQWTMDAIGNGYPTPWLEDTSQNILRDVDMMNSGFWMIHPEDLRTLIRETGTMSKLLRPLRFDADLADANARLKAAKDAGDRAAVETINQEIEILEAETRTKRDLATRGVNLQRSVADALIKIQTRYMKPIALGAPLPIRLVSRVLPDEALRIAVQMQMDPPAIKAMAALGHLDYTTHGEVIINAKQFMELYPNLDQLDVLLSQLNAATAAGRFEEAQFIQEAIDGLQAKFGTRSEIISKLDTYKSRMEQVLPGANRMVAERVKLWMTEERLDPTVKFYERTRYMGSVDPLDKPGKWSRGTARDIGRMSADVAYRQLAKTMLAEGSAGISRLPERFLRGDLRPLYDRLLSNMGRKNSLYPFETIDGVAQLIATYYADLMTRTLGDPVLLGVVATGKLGGRTVERLLPDGSYEAETNLVNFVRENLLPQVQNKVRANGMNPTGPESALTYPAPYFASEMGTKSLEKERLLTKAFNIYRAASNRLRTPYERFKKWQRISELVPVMAPSEAAALVSTLDKTDLPDYFKNMIRGLADRAQGTATRKQVELLGEMYAASEVDQLLYDASNTSYQQYKNVWFWGWFDAWREQFSVWARLLAENPTALERARLVKEGLTQSQAPSWLGGQEGRGIMYKDPETGRSAIAIPLSRLVYNYLGLEGEEVITTNSLTLLGQGVPGVFGFGAFIVDLATPQNADFAALRKVIFPYGDPQLRGKLADYFAPAWASQLAAGLPDNNRLFDRIRTLVVSDRTEEQKASVLNAVLKNMAAQSQSVPVTGQARLDALELAQSRTEVLLGLKGFFRIFLPAASLSKFYVAQGADLAAQGVVLQDLRDMANAADKEGRPYSSAVNQFLEKYGVGAWAFLAGSSKALPGVDPTKEFGAWQVNNSDLLEKYPMVAGYLGPQNGTYDPAVFAKQRAQGLLPAQTGKDIQDQALENLAWAVWDTFKRAQIERGLAQGLTEKQTMSTQQYQAEAKAKSQELKTFYPMWNPRLVGQEEDRRQLEQFQQIDLMVKDPQVLAQPAGKALADYWQESRAGITLWLSMYPNEANETWKSSTFSSNFRQNLLAYGERLVETTPEFKTLWDRVLSREFEPPVGVSGK